MKIGTRVKYTIENLDTAANHTPVGTVIFGTIVGKSKGSLDIKWEKPSITEIDTEYGIPAELFSPA